MHTRLAAGVDPVAPSDFACAYLDPLAAWVERCHPQLHPHECVTAAEDAIVALIKNPHSYRPARQRHESLWAYLQMSARRRLSNLLRSERRHAKRRADWDAVELSPTMGKYVADEAADPASIVEQMEGAIDTARSVRFPDQIQGKLTPQERKVLQLMTMKERKTIVFAQALGISHLPPGEQRRQVKRMKDRLNKRWERAAGHHE